MDKFLFGLVCAFAALIFALIFGFYVFLGYEAVQIVKNPNATAHSLGHIGKEFNDGFNGN